MWPSSVYKCEGPASRKEEPQDSENLNRSKARTWVPSPPVGGFTCVLSVCIKSNKSQLEKGSKISDCNLKNNFNPGKYRPRDFYLYLQFNTHQNTVIFRHCYGHSICISWSHPSEQLWNKLKRVVKPECTPRFPCAQLSRFRYDPYRAWTLDWHLHSLRSMTISHNEFICVIVLSCPQINSMFAWRSKCLLKKFGFLPFLSYLGRYSCLEFLGLFFLKSLLGIETVRGCVCVCVCVWCVVEVLYLLLFFFRTTGNHSSLFWCPLVKGKPARWELRVDGSILDCFHS